MNAALWVLQVLLGLAFVFHSFVMLRPSTERPQGGMKYIVEMPTGLRLFAGTAEGLAGLALVIPPLFRILIWLTPLAAAGLVLLMLCGSVFFVRCPAHPTVGRYPVTGGG